MKRKKQKKRKVILLYSGKPEHVDQNRLYAQSFARLTPEERCKAAWEMAELAWALKGKSKNELRFHRSVALLKKI